MNCREFEAALVLRLLEPMAPDLQAEVDGHRAVCRRCAASFEKAGRLPVLLSLQAEPASLEPAPSWAGLLARIEQGRIRQPRFPRAKVIWGAAGAAAVLLAGILMGMAILRPDRSEPAGATMAADNLLRAYVQRLDPLLVGFQVERKSPVPADIIEFEKRMTIELRGDTALLRETARLAGQSDLVGILDQIDILLISMSHLQSGNREAADQMRRIIRENRQVWESSLLTFGNILSGDNQ